jgi:dihydroxyacetone kinase
LGYVGVGLADGCAVGNLFASPNTDQMLAATRAVDGGAGVLQLYGNYSGDRMNFEFAAEMAGAEGIRVEGVRMTDGANHLADMLIVVSAARIRDEILTADGACFQAWVNLGSPEVKWT